MKDSKIEWTDHTFNPWIGCTKVSPGCANCYAETLMDTRYGRVKWGKGQPRVRTSAANWKLPLRWNDEATAEGCQSKYPVGYRPRVFCASLADWLDDEVPFEWLADLLELIRQTPNLDWLLLTKRPENWASRIAKLAEFRDFGSEQFCWELKWYAHGIAPENVWIGTTVEDQARADERIPKLLEIPARVRFLSCEPLLGPVDIISSGGFGCSCESEDMCLGLCPHYLHALNKGERGIHWVICGGESGRDARPMHPEWARSLRDQCAAAHVPFLFKQWGEYCPAQGRPEAHAHVHRWPDNTAMVKPGKKASGRLLDGREHNEFPKL